MAEIHIDPLVMLHEVMRQAEIDLAAAHAEICKLQGLDPTTHTWPEWSSPANTLRWFAQIREALPLGAAKRLKTDEPDIADWTVGDLP